MFFFLLLLLFLIVGYTAENRQLTPFTLPGDTFVFSCVLVCNHKHDTPGKKGNSRNQPKSHQAIPKMKEVVKEWDVLQAADIDLVMTKQAFTVLYDYVFLFDFCKLGASWSATWQTNGKTLTNKYGLTLFTLHCYYTTSLNCTKTTFYLFTSKQEFPTQPTLSTLPECILCRHRRTKAVALLTCCKRQTTK